MLTLRAAVSHPILALLLAVAPACAGKSKPPAAEPQPAAAPAPEPVVAEEPAPAEPAPPDHSALITALDALDAAIQGCTGKLGTKKAPECAEAVSAALTGLDEPLQSSSLATELAPGRQELQTHADKLTKSTKGGKDKEQHQHLDEVTRVAREMRSKL